ncbi:unnamed protein product [Linum trigynum]|uniref:RNase H type-1 domain-containing protein n=1 Tax=Linum trigynum TaxID=586398 RepID=A0AAV2DHS5_9ROSI
MNSEAGVLKPSAIGLGCVFRNWDGEFLGAVARKETGSCRPVEAEARAIIAGLKEANQRGWSPLIVESDCLNLVKLPERDEEDRTKLCVWCKEIRSLAKVNSTMTGKRVEWAFVPMSSSSMAHCQGHMATHWNQICIWTDCPPNSIRSLLKVEKAQTLEI